MLLPTAHYPPLTIDISSNACATLVKLYNEMIDVHLKQEKFDQDDCDACVIGNGLRSGTFIGMPNNHADPTTFTDAIYSLHLPEMVDQFLFMSEDVILEVAQLLRLPSCTYGKWDGREEHPSLTPLDACVRIAAIISIAGYDAVVVGLPSIPK